MMNGSSTSSCWLVLLLPAVFLLSCAERQRRNPLDPQVDSALDILDPLQAVAGDGQVTLTWDYTRYRDIDSVRVHRRDGAERDSRFSLAASETDFVDEQVENGLSYEYRLGLLVRGSGEQMQEERSLATPGTQAGWVADFGSGLVWKLSPDGRAAVFAQGRFPGLTAIDVDRQTGACWVSDSRVRGLHRISADGEVIRVGAEIEGGGALAVDTEARLGWVVNRLDNGVYWFGVDTLADTVAVNQADATFKEVVDIAVGGVGVVWIADRGAGRVLAYHRDGSRHGVWTGIEDLSDVAVGGNAVGEPVGWALAADGQKLWRLVPDGEAKEIAIPFDRAFDVDAGERDGQVWIVGDSDVASYSRSGEPILHWRELPEGRGLAYDEVHGQLWIASATRLFKKTLFGTGYQTQLTGFTSNHQVVVDPGR